DSIGEKIFSISSPISSASRRAFQFLLPKIEGRYSLTMTVPKRSGDRFNRLWTNFHCNHPHKNIDQSILIGWLEWSLCNDFILQKLHSHESLPHKEFLLSISKELLNR